MKKSYLVTLLSICIFSSSVYAQDPTMKKEEEELKALLLLIEGKLETESKQEKVSNNNQPVTNQDNKKRKIIVEQYLEKPTTEQPQEFSTAAGTINSYDHVYLLNVPIQTKLYANNDIYIYPYRDGIIYKDGEIVSKSPLEKNVETTFCYLKVAESGTIRRFKSADDKFLTITNNYSTKQVFSNENDEVLELYQTTFYIDNEHIDLIRCLTTEKKMPMTIGDMQKQMGNLLKFEFPEIVDI